MYLYEDLKQHKKNEENHVPCPVRNCSVIVDRMRRNDKLYDPRFTCKIHKIRITPTTYAHLDWTENILWKTGEDIQLLDHLNALKRDKGKRLKHECSEDAVTWNVFRYLEKSGQLEGYLNQLSDAVQGTPNVYYWGIEPHVGFWYRLIEAWKMFEEVSGFHRSEPDMIIKTDKSIFYFESKILAGNNPPPSNPDAVRNKYETAANGWFKKVFKDDFDTVALQKHKYQLMRHWLLGTWIAQLERSKFYLVNLVPELKEKDIEAQFGSSTIQNDDRQFKRATWESIYHQIEKAKVSPDQDALLRYMKGKTVGYDSKGNLRKGFNIK